MSELRRLLTDDELATLTWEWPQEWPEYAEIEEAHNALCDAGRLINKPLD